MWRNNILFGGIRLLSIILLPQIVLPVVEALHFSNSSTSFAKFPKWDACTNSSFSFEFKTFTSKALLMYTDDRGKFDYAEVALIDGKVRLRMNIVDGQDGTILITLGERLNDGNWHRVEIQRKRMETTFHVDDKRESMVAFGSDFQFGNIFENNFVYFGGIPKQERKKLDKWSLPSALYLEHFVGDIRNVIYGNCTCASVRGVMIEGTSVSRDPPEACDVKDDCGECLCISSEDGTGCQCEGRTCASDTDTYYSLPMDSLIGDRLGNPSGLDARVIGHPRLVPGIVGKALKIDGRTQEVRVSGPGHRHECFGDLERCPAGYTLALWVRFDRSGKSNNIYLSDGGQSDHSHGVTMYYMSGQLQWLFRTKSGKEWRVTANDILPRGWYHVLVTWLKNEGLRLYINGEKVAHAETSSYRKMRPGTSLNDDFVIGRSNDGSGSRDLGIVTIDDFQFWSSSMSDVMLRENGPVYRYHLPMDRLHNGQLLERQLEPVTHGILRQVPGKFGNAVLIRGNGEYIDLGSFSDTCLGNTTVCRYGLFMSFWVKFHELKDNTYYVASGETGFSISSTGNRLIASVQNGNLQWRASAPGIQTGAWYFIEVSWSLESGLSVFINLKKVASARTTVHNPVTQSRYGNFYIGRANSAMYRENYANATFDDIELFNADRENLLRLDFIQRDKPTHKFYGFDDMTGSRIEHGSSVIQTFGRPGLVPGKIGQALHLTGEAESAEFINGDDCLANLDYCRHGVLVSLWFRADKFSSTSTMHYLSSGINGIAMSSIDGRFAVSAQTSANRWMVVTSDLRTATWYFLEVAWSRKAGLLLYVNKRLVADNLFPTGSTADASKSTDDNGKFVIGSANSVATESMYGAATYDELEYWFASREYLLAFGYIQRDTPTQFLFTMDQQTDGGQSLAHAPFPVILHGEPTLVPGKINNAIQLNGSEQYIDFGDQTDTCLGNLDKCHFGISIFFWVKFDDYDANMYILSTSSLGIRIYYNGGYIYMTLNNKDKSWRTSIPKLSKDEWHYLELSWHPQFGLNLYVDYKLVEHVEYRSIPHFSGTGSRNLLLGGPNSGDVYGQRFSFAFMTVDEFEIWYGRREMLLAFDYIVRDNVGYESFSMETASNDVIDHPRYNITLERGARLIPGKIGNAVTLEGRGQYVNLGEHMDTCLGNLDLCNHGITISLWLKPKNLRNNTYYLSSPTYDLLYKNSKLRGRVISHGKVWNVETRKFKKNEWNQVMLSWDRKDGLELYIDNDVMSIDRAPVEAAQRDDASAGNLYIGKSSDEGTTGRSADIMADEVQYWFANIERLRAQGIFDGPIHEVIPISQMSSSGVLKLPTRTITLHGGATIVRGQHFGAVKLSGKGQYIDLGENLTCGGNLEKCRQGFTMRFSTKPEKLVRNMYFLDSYPVSIFYRDGKLYATVRTPTKTWTVAAPGFKSGEWQVVDVSWHPEIGLTMYINDEEVGAHKTHATEIDPQYDWDTKTYFGRALDDMGDKRYADAAIENFEVWNVRRDALLSKGRISGDVGVKPEVMITTRAPPPPNDAGTEVRQIFVTSVPNANSQGFSTRILNNTYASTSKIIRFFGDSYVRYDFNVLPAEMLAQATKESLSFTFITQDTEGLMWMFKTAGYKMHISMKEGSLLFVIDDGLLPQQVVITSPNSRPLNDFRWHSLKIDKEGKVLKFYMDEKYVTQLTARANVQFVARGEVDLGGTPLTKTNTGGLVETNFDGALTDVECRKFTGPSRELIISFLQFVESASQTGDIEIFDRDRWNSGNWSWNRFTTTRAPPTPSPKRPTPVTFTSATSAFFLRDPLDMRTSGSVGFRFRTLEPRGLLTLARGSAQGNNFVAIELFDGILYFVYNFGSYSNRKQFATRRVDDGEWHEVRFESDGRRIYMTLDGMKYPINLKSDEMMKMYFYRLFIGGYAIDNMPWPIYSRMGYRGCLASLEINDLGVDLHSRFRDANANGVEVGCRDFARFCQTQPCSSGACKDRMGSYMCNCANTPFSGTNCDTEAAIASWDGTKTTNYEFVNRDVTHTNDLSFRFMTPLADTLLFKTEVSNSDDYIKAELVGGRVKVTIKVGTEMKSFFTGNNVNDYFWHTLYIRRRANDIEVWVDEEPRSVGLIDREDFNLQIDRLIFGSLGEKGSLSSNNYIGYMQNFMYDDIDVFSQLRQLNSNVYWITGMTPDNLPLLTYKPVTVTTNEAHFKLPYLRIGRTMKILFKFKTRESNGLILYNSGVGNDVIAIELSNGQLRLAYNLGGRNMFTVVPTQNALNDNQWHTVQVALSERGQFSLRVDGETMDVTASDGDNKLTLRNTLFIGGLPEEMYQQPAIRNLIESRKGFRGCLASMDLNGAVPDLLNYATDSQQVLDGCTDIQAACKPNACGPGACMPMAADYWCDCNMTGYTGIPCTEYPVGYYFGRNGNSGMVVYEYPFSSRTSSNLDRIAFGFMTKQKDGVLYRVQGTADNEYIEIRIENGFIVAESNTGGGKILLQENSRKFNDGSYHVVRYIRTGSNSTLQVDQLNTNTATHTGTMSLFDKVHMVMLGGRADKSGAIINKFNGIMGGAYYNGYRWFDMLLGGKALHGKLVKMQGDVLLTKPFILIKGGGVVKPTPSPPDIYIPPDEDVADLTGGGGVIGPGFGGPGSGPPGVIGIGGPGGLTGLPGGVSINVPGQPVALASAGGPAPPPMATGARAGAVVGTVIGTLAFMSSLMWALYKLKPGVPTCLSPGAGSAGAGAGGGGMSISSPRATSNIGAVQAVSAGSGGGGGGAGAGAGKVTVVNGSASAGGAGAGAGGGGSSTYTSYFQSTSTSVGGGGGAGSGGLVAGSAGSAGGGSAGMDQFDSATLRATGTFSNKGTAIGTPKAVRSNMGSSSSSYAANYQTNTMQSYGSGSGGDTLAMGGGGGGGTFDRQQYLSASSANDGPDYDLPVSGTMQSGNSYSSSTLNTHYNYQVSESFSNPRFITSKDMFVTGNTTDRNNQSVLAVVAARNTTYLGPVRYEVYTTTLRPDTNQAYVDRAEDLVIEQAPDIVTRKSRVTPNDVNIGSGQSQVTIQTGSSAFAKYQAHTDVHDYVTLLDDQSWTARNNQTAKERQTSVSQIDIDISPVLKTEAAPQTRKSSLQITPKYEAKVGEYVHLESYSSETNINAKSGISSLKRTDKSYSTDASLDNLYESTTTITSTVRSDSIENNLFSLNEEETPGGARTSSGRLDLLMASLDDIGNSFVMIDETNTCGDELHGDIYAKVNKTKQSGELQASSIEMKRMNFATSCMAEIRDDHTDSSITETLIALDGTNTRNELMPDANLSLTFAGAPTRDRQTDRTENVIEHDKQTITKPPRKLSKPTINISEFRDADKMTTSFTFDIAKNSPDVIRETNVTKTNATKTNVIETNAIETKWNMNFTETKKTDYSGEEFNTLQEELDKSVNELLAGIDLDTSEWTAVKDITSLNGSSAGTAETDDWEVQNLKTVTINRQGQYVMSGMSGTGSGAVTPGAAGDEVRVDCCLMTTDGRSVVTGSSLGPPQVWDMQTGELQNIMKGDSIGSTNLHLVCGDRLMVGAVHADMEINEYSGRKGVFNHTLQIWDFSTGKPLSMAEGEYCSAMCPMSDSDKVLFGRTDKYGDATSVIAWDLLGNQAIKEMRYDAPVGNNDYISYLNLSNNDRYVVAGFTNSFDNQAEFMVFDMTLTSYNISEPAMLKLDANPECTAILPRDEAVTGLRNGDLVIWSIRTGQPSRQLMGGGGAHAHGREVKSVTLSKDGQYLVSTSADGTAKVWDMHTERPIHTLSGHTDEVWCSAVSTDNEIVATGSNDGTIRLWRMKNGTEMCVFNCGVDIFFLTMSHDKGTIVALGDKFGARKLIMLQVVRTKIKKIVSS